MPSPVADVILCSGRLFTGDPRQPRADAVAVRGNRILYVGDDAGALEFRGEKTRLIDAKGRTVTPGFIDSHVHLLSGAAWMGYADLSQAQTTADVREAFHAFASQNSTEAWLIGWRIRYDVISNRHQLDEMFSDRPMYVRAADAHTAWANTRALEMAGVLHAGSDENILRDADGVATGELRESGMKAILDVLPPAGDSFIRTHLKRAVEAFNSTGITSVHNMNGNMRDLTTYAAAEDAGELNLRVYVPFEVRPEAVEADLQEALAMSAVSGEYVRGGAVKFFMDGVWESYTAYNIHPYADAPEVRVEPLFSLEHFTRMAAACDRLGLQIAVHCCGDGAVRQTLDGYESVQEANGPRDSRHRIEHVEVCQPEDMPRFARLGVIASIQLSHAPLTLEKSGVAQFRLGKERWRCWQPWRDLKNAGARLSFGSDWTVVPFDPLTHIHVALNREKLSPEATDQRLTLEECLIGYTREAAFVEFLENEKGQIKAGYLADLAMFSQDLFELPPAEITSARVVWTMMDGRTVFEDPAAG